MKKIIALVLTVALLLACCSFAAADGVPEGYPEIIPGLDFGGETIHIYAWWDNPRKENPSPDEQLRYDYIDWLQKTYNCTIVEEDISGGDYKTITTVELADFVKNGDPSKLCFFTTDPNFAAGPLTNDLFMEWTIDLSGEQWNQACIDFGTYKGKVLGVNVGGVQPRECIFFNKQILADAGIDYNDLYDAQADGSWTWEKMESYMDQIMQKDEDNDGLPDIYGVTGNGGRITRGLVYGNNACFFDYNDEGKLVPVMDSENCMQSLNKRYEWAQKYIPKKDDFAPDGSWNWFEGFWKEGKVLFFAGQAYEGYIRPEQCLMPQCEFDWGCIAFPKGPAADDYAYAGVTNLVSIPNVYDEETSLKLQQIYALYTAPTPGVDADTSWIEDYWAETMSDDRAVEETYAMLREQEHVVANKQYFLGDEEAVMGPPLYYQIDWVNPATLVEAAMPDWQFQCDIFNGDKTAEDYEQWKIEEEARKQAEAEQAAAEAEEAEEPAE